MKITIELVEKVTRTLEIETDEYMMTYDGTEYEKIFRIAEIINEAKEDPTEFFVNDMHSVVEEREQISTKVY